jgi:hypothetical protein
MPLPAVQHETREVDGITVRGLTRGEALNAYQAAEGGENVREFEIALIAGGTDTPVDEVREWYDSAPMDSAGRILDAVRALTGLSEDREDPKASSPSSED